MKTTRIMKRAFKSGVSLLAAGTVTVIFLTGCGNESPGTSDVQETAVETTIPVTIEPTTEDTGNYEAYRDIIKEIISSKYVDEQGYEKYFIYSPGRIFFWDSPNESEDDIEYNDDYTYFRFAYRSTGLSPQSAWNDSKEADAVFNLFGFSKSFTDKIETMNEGDMLTEESDNATLTVTLKRKIGTVGYNYYWRFVIELHK